MAQELKWQLTLPLLPVQWLAELRVLALMLRAMRVAGDLR